MTEEKDRHLEPIFEAFYIKSIIYTCGRALEAFQRYDDGLLTSRDAEVVVGHLHEALIHSAALSRFFWPIFQQKIHVSRGEKLKEAFGLQEDSPLNTKDLRDALEHFDERLDKFLLEDHIGYFFPEYILGLESLNDDPLLNIFRLVDPATNTFILLGRKYNFELIRETVKNVYDQAIKADESGGKL